MSAIVHTNVQKVSLEILYLKYKLKEQHPCKTLSGEIWCN